LEQRDRDDADREAIARVDTLGRTEGLDLLHAGVAASGEEGHWQGLLSNVHFNLHPGEMCAVLSTVDAGKEDLIGLLLGVRNLSAGTLRLGGREGLALGSVGYVARGYELDPSLTVRETLEFGARLRLPQMDDTNRTIRLVNLCQEMDLDRYMGTRVGKLPPGVDRLVVLTLELMTDPEVMILDEPMRGLSNDLGSDFMLRLERVADRGCAVLIFTHPMEAVRRCDAVLVLYSRVVAYFGPPEAALEYFAVESLESIEDALKRASPELWHQLCRTSMWNSNFLHRKRPNRKQHHDHLVSGRLDAEHWQPMPVRDQVQGHLRRIGLRWRRTARPVLLLGSSAAGGAVIGFVPGLDHQFPLLAASALALGLLNAGPEIVRERSVLERERYFELSMLGYLLSVAIVVVTSSVIAALVGVAAASIVGSLPGAFGVRLAACASATLAGSGIGLLLSSIARETAQVRTLAILVAVAQLVLLVVAPPIVTAYTPAGPAETALFVSAAPDFQGNVVLATLAGGAIWLAVGWGLGVMALMRRREF
jgi:ABC-type multidrug transport system ATPase subunit